MKLTRKQKKYIQKHLYKKSLDAIANDLNISKNTIKTYLQKQLSLSKYQALLDQEQKNNNSASLKYTNFKNWLFQNRWQIFTLAFLVFITYLNSLPNQFVSDDINGIVKNPTLNNIKVIFDNPFASFHLFVYYSINQLFGHSAAAFRFVSILFHLANVISLYFLISLLFTPRIGFLTSLLFAVHPLLSEAVVWISAGYTVYATFWTLLSLIFFSLYLHQPRSRLYILSILFYFLALESSEKVIPFPIILLFYLISNQKLKKYWLKLTPFFVLSLIWGRYLLKAMAKRTVVLEQAFYQQIPNNQNLWQLLNTTFKQTVVATNSYFKLFLWPQKLTLYHSELIFTYTQYMIMIIIFLLYLGSIIYFYFRNKKLFFWLLFFLLALSPTLTPYKISWIVAERYVYMASIGLFVTLSFAFDKLLQNHRFKDVLWICFGLIIFALLTRTIIRNTDWKNQDTLWLSAAKTSPSSPQNRNNLGDYYARRQQWDKAIQEFKTAIRLKPNYADAYHNLANTYRRIGRDDLAIQNYQKALQINPRLWQSYANLAIIYFYQQKFDLAATNFEKAIQINPKNTQVLMNLAVTYLKLNQPQKAKQTFQKVLQIDPNNQQARQALSLDFNSK